MTNSPSVPGFILQHQPCVICAMVPGRWLLERTTPSWRIKDPHTGFQRMVNSKRAKEIAVAVLNQQRTFPNAIVLATDKSEFPISDGLLNLPSATHFLVVDGQHRLWAQQFSTYNASYACIIHTGLRIDEMADLFLEINDNQKRVPSSLRWDLVRLVRPEDDPEGIGAAEIVYLLATENDSPFFQRIDLTGEQPELQIKQGSLAPEFKSLLSRRSPLRNFNFHQQYTIIFEYSAAIRDIDADGWRQRDSVFFKARVLRALFKLLADIARLMPDRIEPLSVTAAQFTPFLERIDVSSLDQDKIRAIQGSAGIKAIYDTIKQQVFADYSPE